MKTLNDFESCKCNIIHNEVIEKVRLTLIDEETAFNLGDFFKVLGDSSRVKIIHALSLAEMCVCDISALLNMSQSAISHQLKVLRQSKLVKYRRDGKVVYYSLVDNHVNQILSQGLLHVNEK